MEWIKSSKTILGMKAQRRKIPVSAPDEPKEYEYRLKLPLGEIWQYHPEFRQYNVLTGSYQAAKDLKELDGVELVSGQVEPNKLSGGEEWQFMFHEEQAKDVLRVLDFSGSD